jgi:hypothetical protein
VVPRETGGPLAKTTGSATLGKLTCMPKRNLAFFDPKHNEWLYDMICSLNHEQKARLNHKELRQIRTKSDIKKFVATGNLERKLILLTKAGVEWSILFWVPKKFSNDVIKEAYRQYSIKGKSVEVIDEMLKSKTFVLSSRDVAISLAMMNQNCHSELFMPNIEFLKFRKFTNEMHANISRGMSEKNLNLEYQTAYNGLRMVASVVNQAMLMYNDLASTHCLQPLDIVILNMLFLKPHNYVSMDYIRRELKTDYKPQSIGLRCVYLWKQRGMLDKMPAKENVPSYRITQLGILTVGEVANTIVKNASNT